MNSRPVSKNKNAFVRIFLKLFPSIYSSLEIIHILKTMSLHIFSCCSTSPTMPAIDEVFFLVVKFSDFFRSISFHNIYMYLFLWYHSMGFLLMNRANIQEYVLSWTEKILKFFLWYLHSILCISILSLEHISITIGYFYVYQISDTTALWSLEKNFFKVACSPKKYGIFFSWYQYFLYSSKHELVSLRNIF